MTDLPNGNCKKAAFKKTFIQIKFAIRYRIQCCLFCIVSCLLSYFIMFQVFPNYHSRPLPYGSPKPFIETT